MPAGIDPISLGADAAGTLIGGIETISNIAKEKRDRKALENLHDPFYQIQNEYYQNRNLTGQQAESGLPSATKDYVTGEMERGLGAGISGTLQSGGSPNDINKLFSTFNKSIDATGAQDAERHTKNIQYFIEANKDLAGQKGIQFGFNKVMPYQRKLAQITQNLSNEQTNAYNGANQMVGSLNAAGTSLSNSKLLNMLFKDGSGSTPAPFGASPVSVEPVGNLAAPPNVGGLAPEQVPVFNNQNG